MKINYKNRREKMLSAQTQNECICTFSCDNISMEIQLYRDILKLCSTEYIFNLEIAFELILFIKTIKTQSFENDFKSIGFPLNEQNKTK